MKQGNKVRELNTLCRSKRTNKICLKKAEVYNQGEMSQSRHIFENPVYDYVILKLHQSACNILTYRVVLYYICQHNLIACLDNITSVSINDLTPNIEHNFVLNSKMCYGKNLTEEQDLPEEMIFGAHDPNYCALLACGVQLRQQ